MDDYIKFNNQTAGRDKVFRFLQYCSRFLWYNLEKRGKNQQAVEKAKKLDETLGLMRRLLRFGRFFDTLHSALPVMSTVSDHVIRFTSVISRISSSCFMAIDHAVCLHKLGILPKNFMDAGAWDKTSTRFWLYSILMGLIRDFYEIKKIFQEASQGRRRKLKSHNHHHRSSQSDEGQNNHQIIKGLPANWDPTIRHCVISAKIFTKCVTKHADITIDLLKNVCDLCIPLTVLGHIKLSPGTLSFLGMISTVCSAIPQINPMVKMVPAM